MNRNWTWAAIAAALEAHDRYTAAIRAGRPGEGGNEGESMAKINFRELAKVITAREGKKESVSIAQVSEVLRITLEELASRPASEALALIEKHRRPESVAYEPSDC